MNFEHELRSSDSDSFISDSTSGSYSVNDSFDSACQENYNVDDAGGGDSGHLGQGFGDLLIQGPEVSRGYVTRSVRSRVLPGLSVEDALRVLS